MLDGNQANRVARRSAHSRDARGVRSEDCPERRRSHAPRGRNQGTNGHRRQGTRDNRTAGRREARSWSSCYRGGGSREGEGCSGGRSASKGERGQRPTGTPRPTERETEGGTAATGRANAQGA